MRAWLREKSNNSSKFEIIYFFAIIFVGLVNLPVSEICRSKVHPIEEICVFGSANLNICFSFLQSRFP